MPSIRLLFIILSSCATDTTDSLDPDPICDNAVTDLFPEDGASDVYYRGTIEAHLACSDETMSVTVTDEHGSIIDGVTSLGGSEDERIIFTPSPPLSPDTSYTATISMCERSQSWSFQTMGLCPPVTTDLVGQTYSLDLDDARVTEPEGVGPIITTLMEQSLLLGVIEASGDRLQVLGAFAEGARQDRCLPTIDFPEASFAEDLYFVVGPQDVTLSAGGLLVTVYSFKLSGTFATDGSSIDNVSLAGEVDARDLAPLLWEASLIEENTPAAVCELLADFAVDCVPCDRDGAPLCISVVADSIVADALPGITLEPITEPDPDCP
ncbi:MAG: hypothetical protein ACI8S6_000932 [Myxococcota bacterium]|jgi:hypothetical protein